MPRTTEAPVGLREPQRGAGVVVDAPTTAPAPAAEPPARATSAPAPVRPPTPPAAAAAGRPWRRFRTRAILLAAAILVVLGLALAFRPKPLEVEAAAVTRGPMRVTVDADAVTRVRQPFAIAAPVSGLVERISVRPGDVVRAGEPVASISTPPLFDAERQAVEARVAAARASSMQFDTRISQAQLAVAQAVRDEARARQLLAGGAIAERDLELAVLTVATRRADLAASRAQQRVARAELDQARAALSAAIGAASATTIVRAPTAGRVLTVPQRSARVVAAGTPLLDLGNPDALEIAADVLSSDAAQVRPGQAVILRGWGGTPLNGVVRVVEPSARTRVSALGVEEQRLTVVIDASPMPAALGDGYRLDASIVVWEGRPLRVPASALLRDGEAWTVFVVRDGRASRRRVEVGHVGGGAAEVRGGLAPGDRVVLFPPDELRDGARVKYTT